MPRRSITMERSSRMFPDGGQIWESPRGRQQVLHCQSTAELRQKIWYRPSAALPLPVPSAVPFYELPLPCTGWATTIKTSVPSSELRYAFQPERNTIHRKELITTGSTTTTICVRALNKRCVSSMVTQAYDFKGRYHLTGSVRVDGY